MAKKTRSRPANNPTLREVQLKGMVQALSATAEHLDTTNKLLTTEASAVLEAVWNGHQELSVKVEALEARLAVLEPTPIVEEPAPELELE